MTESAQIAMGNFGFEQECAVFGYIRNCEPLLNGNALLKEIPNEMMALCVLFYQTEAFQESSEYLSISSSKFFQSDTVKSNFPDIQRYNNSWNLYPADHSFNGYVKGSLKINDKMSLKSLIWKFRIIKPCPMKIGITADKLNVDTVLHINGDHRFHALSYVGLLSSHRKTYSTQSRLYWRDSLFPKHSIITMTIDMDNSHIVFQVDDNNGKELLKETSPERINFNDEYKMVVYMAAPRHSNKGAMDGCIQLLDFQMEHK